MFIIDKFLNVARAVSYTSKHRKVKIGACLVKSHSIVATGVNTNKSHPMQKMYNRYRKIAKLNDCLHAEMQAMLKAERLIDDFTGTSIYVYRENKLGELAMCKPCPACMAKIRELGIMKIVYTTNGGINTLDRRIENDNL